MKKFIKILLIVVIIIGVLFTALTFTPVAGTPIKKAIEYFGSKALQTQVTVDQVDLNVAEGKISLKNFRIANLEKFDKPYLFEMGEINVNADIKSLMSDVIVIKSIDVKYPIIYVENFGENLRALTKNLEKAKTKEETIINNEEETTSPDKASKKLAIEEFKLNGAEVVLSDSISLPLPNIELKNLGTADNAATPVDIATEIFKVITRDTLKAIKNTGTKAVNGLLNKLF